MEGIKDLSGIKDSLLILKSVLFLAGYPTCLTVDLVKVINRLENFATFQDLCSEIRVEVMRAVNYLTKESLDYYREMAEVGSSDPDFDVLRTKLDFVEMRLNFIKKFL